MKITDIISENFSGAFASVAMPMTPGTTRDEAYRSVYQTKKQPKKKSPPKPPMIKR